MPNFDRIYKLHRVLKIHRHPVSEFTLMEEIACSRSTLFRTIEFLRDRLGAPIENHRGQGYYYSKEDGSFELPGVWFRANELEALLTVHHLINNLQPGMLDSQIVQLRDKVSEILQRSTTNPSHQFPTKRFRILASHTRSLAEGVFELSAQSIIERRQLEFDFAGRYSNDQNRRTTSPQRLVHYRDHWHLDAWDEQKQELRTFALDGMRDVTITEQPARDVPDDQLDEALTRGYGLFAGPVQGHAKLVFSGERAEWVSQESWHPDQQGRFREDGTYELILPYSDPRELLGEILRHGPHVQVEAPEALVILVRDSLRESLCRYG